MLRYFWVFSFMLLLGVPAMLQAQTEARIHATYDNESLIAVLQDLKAQVPGLSINYDPALVQGISIHKRFSNTPLSDVLDYLLHTHDLAWEVAKFNTITIRKEKVKQRTYTIYGKVMAAESGEALQGVFVRSYDQQQRTKTDVNGDFILEVSQSIKVDSLILGFEGYTTQIYSLVEHKAGDPLTILMRVRQSNISPVLIEDGADQTVKVADQASEMSLKPERVAHLSSLGGPDVMRAIQLLPGIQGDQEGAAGLQVRGGSADQTLVMLDGITIYEPGHFYGMISLFNSRAIDKVKLIRGGFGPAYGGRTSAVIDMEGRPKRIDTTRVSAGINLLQTAAHIETPILKKYKGSLLLAGRRTFTDVWASPTFSRLFNQYFQQGVIHDDQKAPAPDGAVRTMRPRFHFGDLNAKFTLKPGESDLLTISALAARDRLVYDNVLNFDGGGREENRDEIVQQNLGVSAKWTRVWNEDFTSKLTTAYSSYAQAYTFNYLAEGGHGSVARNFGQQNTIADMSVRSDNMWKIADQQRLHFGLHATRFQTRQAEANFDSALDSLPVDGFNLDQRETLISLYAEDHLDLSPNITLSIGGRANRFSGTGGIDLAPRMKLTANLGESWSLKMASGRYFQYLQRISARNYIQAGEEIWVMADNESTTTSSADHLIAGVGFQRQKWTVDLELYAKQYRGLSTYHLNERLAAFSAHELMQYHTDGTGQTRGLDFLIKWDGFEGLSSIERKNRNIYTTWISYTLSQTTHQFDGIDSGRVFMADQDQRHAFNWVHSISLAQGFKLSATWVFRSGRPFTPAEEVKSAGGLQGFEEITYGNRNSERLPAYHRLDLAGQYEFRLGKSIMATTGVSVYNAYNRRNLRNRLYSLHYTTSPTGMVPQLVSIDQELLGISPNIFINLVF